MTDQPVLLETVDGVATIRLNRPEAMNSLDLATKVALLESVRAAAADPAARVVVLTGTGRAFCVGQDLKQHAESLAAGNESLGSTVDEHYSPTVLALLTMDKPVVTAVNGVAAGAGMSYALAGDFRILAASASFNSAFAGIGLSCDTGSSWTLQRLVGRSQALDLLYFPRKVDSAEALELGLASRVVADEELESVVGELAARLAQGPTLAYGAIRRSVEYAAGHSFAEALEFESARMAETGATDDHRAAVAAFLAKERPTFNGR